MGSFGSENDTLNPLDLVLYSKFHTLHFQLGHWYIHVWWQQQQFVWGLSHAAWHGHASSSAGLTTALGAATELPAQEKEPISEANMEAIEEEKGGC